MRLFSREIKVSVEQKDGMLDVAGYLNDDRHEMKVCLTIIPGAMSIEAAGAEMIRAPYEICRRALEGVKLLKGLQVKPGINKKVWELMGGSKGCVHIRDLINEAFKGAVQADIQLKVWDLTGNSRYKALQQILQGSCLRYPGENSAV